MVWFQARCALLKLLGRGGRPPEDWRTVRTPIRTHPSDAASGAAAAALIMGLSYSCLMEPSCGSPWIRTHAPWLLYYQTPKYIKVDVPEVGVLYYTCVVIAMLVALLPLHFSNAWAMTEVPGGIVNAWSTQGGMPSTTSVSPAALTAPYCAEPWMLQLGQQQQQQQQTLPCRLFRPSELTYKTEAAVAFTSALTETRTTGWRCADDGNLTRRTACSTRGGVPFQRQSGQCGCELRQTVFPFAVERMSLNFEHAYVVEGSWRGSSVRALPGEEGLWSELVFANGTRLRFDAGVALQLPLSEWLAAAGISLDAPNPSRRPGPSGITPNRRSTGTSLRVDISYTNLDPYSRRAVIGDRSVHAEVRLSSVLAVDVEVGRQSAVWVGSAALRGGPPSTPATALPGGPPSEFDIIDRHRRGVVFKFHVTGQVYAFDFFVLLKVLLSAVVLAGWAKLIADVVAFYCLPNGTSTVLRNKREELVSKRGEFAELGMKAALAALIYRDLDPDNNGAIEPVYICKAFAHAEKSDGTPWVPWEKAHAIAHTVLKDADTDVDAAQGAYGLSFSELATCLHGQSIDFDAFLKNLDQETTKGSRKEADMERCRRAFEEERALEPVGAACMQVLTTAPLPLPTGAGAPSKRNAPSSRPSSRRCVRVVDGPSCHRLSNSSPPRAPPRSTCGSRDAASCGSTSSTRMASSPRTRMAVQIRMSAPCWANNACRVPSRRGRSTPYGTRHWVHGKSSDWVNCFPSNSSL